LIEIASLRIEDMVLQRPPSPLTVPGVDVYDLFVGEHRDVAISCAVESVRIRSVIGRSFNSPVDHHQVASILASSGESGGSSIDLRDLTDPDTRQLYFRTLSQAVGRRKPGLQAAASFRTD
jgi:hypothetical protein